MIERPVVRTTAWICLSWFGCAEHDCRRAVNACLVKQTGGLAGFWIWTREENGRDGLSGRGKQSFAMIVMERLPATMVSAFALSSRRR